MALPAQDSFTTATTQSLTSYSANWTISYGGFSVDATADAVYPTSAAAESGAYWNADTFNADQYAQATLSNIVVADASIGVAVRCSSGGNYYGLYYTGGAGGMVFIFKLVSGTFGDLGYATVGAWSVGDVLRLEISGTTLTPKRNGTVISAIGAKTDTSLSSGSAGICGYDTNSDCRLDDWQGGDLGGAADVPLALLRRRRAINIDSWR